TIGDVSGKGMPAALYMARLISDFRFQAHQAEDPVPTMTILNEMLAERSQQGMFVTMVYLTLDSHYGRINYVNGGHIPPILFRRATGEISRLDGSEGIPLGIMANTKFVESQHMLMRGDTLILFSDGILDARNSRGEKYSVQQIVNVLRGAWQSPGELVSQIVEAVTRHAGQESQYDDITIMVLQWR
ncbi:MAG TPA: PP2C family protein-serine/threonine phosphatase, partial [Candidatus Glassbacteria bacterium]|nr:PP2C family protein-serine/threonine phosphatase [Candidatus Glassbacteria bacterium]